MRRFNLNRVVPAIASATSCTGSFRSMIVYSENSPVLENNQKARNSPYNAWIEDWELARLGLVPLANDASPTVVVVEKIIELVNMSCVQNQPQGLLECPAHASWLTHKPYGQALQFQLQNEAVKNNFSSKWWLTRSAAKNQNFTLRSGTKEVKVATKGKLNLFHASQFENPFAVQKAPVSGATRKLYSNNGLAFAVLNQAVIDNKYSSGLFFTRKQLDQYAIPVQPAAVPVLHAVTLSDNFKFYNLDQLENPKAVLEALGRSTVDVPTFLLSGERIKVPLPPNNFQSKYYLSGRDAELYNFNILESEKSKGIALSERTQQRSEMSIEFFNADQTVDPARSFAVAGTLPKSN